MQGYFKSNNPKKVIFDVFFRKNPFQGGYAIMCGLAQLIEYVENLHFTEDDISYLKSTDLFDDSFLESLQSFKFTGDIDAIPEGSVIFPNEPIIKIKAPNEQEQQKE